MRLSLYSNPGHAIEAAWFLLELARIRKDDELRTVAIEKFLCRPLTYGWDHSYGGLFYYLDADGLSPTQLEWRQKLWWPHCEALIATLMAYRDTRHSRYLADFDRVFKYCYSHVSKPGKSQTKQTLYMCSYIDTSIYSLWTNF